jgi:hypothetical protein
MPYPPRCFIFLVKHTILYGVTGRGFLSCMGGEFVSAQKEFMHFWGCGQGARSTPHRWGLLAPPPVKNPSNSSTRLIRMYLSAIRSAMAIAATIRMALSVGLISSSNYSSFGR